jgi:hypothetical protein
MQCLAKLEDYIKTAKYIMDDPHFVGRYNNIKSKCSSDLYNPKLLKRFKEFTDILDTNRGQSLKSVNPSLYEILENV